MPQLLHEHQCPYGKDYICISGIRYQLWPGFRPGDCSRPHELDRDDLLFRGQCYCCCSKATDGLAPRDVEPRREVPDVPSE